MASSAKRVGRLLRRGPEETLAQVVLLSGCGFGAGIAVGVWLLRRLAAHGA